MFRPVLLAVCSAAALSGLAEIENPKAVVKLPPVKAATIFTNAAGHAVADFGQHAFGWLEVDAAQTGRYEIVWGELLNDAQSVQTDRLWTVDEGTIRCAVSTGVFERVGLHRIPLQPTNGSRFYRGHGGQNYEPEQFGNVMPFRWAEIVELPFALNGDSLRQVGVRYPFDMNESRFVSSSADLDRVMAFCKHSIAATSFLGRFIDGDRERLTYEADSYIAQLGSYAMSSDAAVARTTLDWVSTHSTWPTEWKQFFVRMCWADWMQTGDTSRIKRYYALMRDKKIWSKLAREDGLLVTGESETASDDKPSDIVDWAKGYRDGFVFRPVNAVVNALRYRNLTEMSEMANAIGLVEDAKSFRAEAERVQKAYVKVLVNEETGLVRDGEGTDHTTVQANAMALACEVLPGEFVAKVADYVVSKGMTCSTYMAQFVLEGLCRAGRADAALNLMTTKGPRGWLAMLEKGATITPEFWDLTMKEPWRVPDMNHAWSTATLNIVTRFILGVRPKEAGADSLLIAPQLGSLTHVEAVVPTAKGSVGLNFNRNGEGWNIVLELPVSATFVWQGQRHDFVPGRHVFRESVTPRVILDDGRLVQPRDWMRKFSPLNSGWEEEGAACLRPFNRVPAGRVDLQAVFNLAEGAEVKVEFLDCAKRPLFSKTYRGPGVLPVAETLEQDGSLKFLRLTPNEKVDRAKLFARETRVFVNWALFMTEHEVYPLKNWVPPFDASLLTDHYAVEFSAWIDSTTRFNFGGVDITRLYDYYPGLWYRLRFEVEKGAANFKLNGRVIARDVKLKDFEFENRSPAKLRIDDLKICALENPTDYPPRPVVPKGTEKALVGMNICSLWRNGHHWGWNCVDRAGRSLPVLGYYDEGLPETADWEIKYFVEHGVDFQAFCWYGDTDDGALRRPRNGYQLEDGFKNARYSDMMKYCLIWEIQNAGRPHTLEAWQKNYAPYFIEHYFKDPRYLVLDGQPVLAVFGGWNFSTTKKGFGSVETTRKAFDWLREEVKKHGFKGVIFVSSHWGNCKAAKEMGFDVFLPYNYGGKANTAEFNRTCNENRLAASQGVDVFTPPALAVGFDNVPWGGRAIGMLSAKDMRDTLVWMRDEFGPKTWKKNTWQENFHWICTWNEYGEGTYTMPTKDSRGFGYLDAIRDVMTDAGVDPAVNTVPDENQLARITSLYPQAPWAPLKLTLSFDDNLKDHYTVAAPELEKRGWRGLFCIVPNWLSESGNAMSWNDVRDLVKRGHEIAIHTLSHANLKQLAEAGNTNEVRRQIVECADVIQKQTGVRPRFLCLPGTQWNDDVVEIARANGFQTMLVPRQCFGDFPNDPRRVIARLRKAEAPRTDFLVHGIRPKDPADPTVGGGWKPFPSRKAFCDYLDAIKAAELEGEVSVGTYGR